MALLCAASAYSATPTVSHAASSQAGAATVTETLTVTSGDLAIACMYSDVAATQTFSVTDSASQTGYLAWTNSPFGVGNGRSECFYKPNTAALTSITCNYSTSGTNVCAALDIAGAATGTPFDANATNAVTVALSATGTTLVTGSALSTSNANDILIYWVGENTTSSGWAASGTGWSIPSGIAVATIRGSLETKGVSATGSQGTATMNWTTSGGDRLGLYGAFADTNQANNVSEDDSWFGNRTIPVSEPTIILYGLGYGLAVGIYEERRRASKRIGPLRLSLSDECLRRPVCVSTNRDENQRLA